VYVVIVIGAEIEGKSLDVREPAAIPSQGYRIEAVCARRQGTGRRRDGEARRQSVEIVIVGKLIGDEEIKGIGRVPGYRSVGRHAEVRRVGERRRAKREKRTDCPTTRNSHGSAQRYAGARQVRILRTFAKPVAVSCPFSNCPDRLQESFAPDVPVELRFADREGALLHAIQFIKAVNVRDNFADQPGESVVLQHGESELLGQAGDRLRYCSDRHAPEYVVQKFKFESASDGFRNDPNTRPVQVRSRENASRDSGL
jgi:hypothetical protein